MARKTKKYKLVNSVDFKNQIITHLKRYNKFCFLDGNNSHDKYSSFDYLAAFDSKIEYKQTKNPFEGLKQFSKKHNDWMFGYFSYDLKNDIEDLESKNIDNIQEDIIFKGKIGRIRDIKIEKHTGIPTSDFVRFGPSKIWDLIKKG